MNPLFKTRGPLDAESDAALIVDRPELATLLRATQSPTVDAYYAILSARQTGKTTLLYQLRARLRARGYGVALLDLSGVREQPEPEFYRFVASQIQSELDPILPRKLKSFADADLPHSPIEFRKMLFEFARQVQVARLVILIDEVEGVPDAFADAFFGTIRNIFSSRRKEDEAPFEKYFFVFCGAKELHRLTTGPNSPLNIAERLYLQDFSLAGVKKLVAVFTRAKIRAPGETAQWVYDQTRGHPYLTQKLCATLEQARPATITSAHVLRATQDILRSDDHLEKMLIQIAAEAPSENLIKAILQNKQVRFSRLQPEVARAELLGALRDAGNCVIRNPIYEAALRARFSLPLVEQNATTRLKNNWRRLLPIAAAVLLTANLPVLYLYVNDIVLAPKQVNERFEFSDPNVSGVMHYDRVLKAGRENATTIILDAEKINSTAPIFVAIRKSDADILVDGSARRPFTPPSQSETYKIALNSSAMPYNPFDPFTAHRRVDFVFESASGSAPQIITVDYRVDFYSAFLVSIFLVVGGILTALASIAKSWQRIREFFSPPEQRQREEDDDED
ncbi:MAG: AAA-like domain-containing protein [Chloroflexi bacterium]|nr:AAA-like domain-containing protein [Chloroflexota bacterium]